MQCGNPFEEHTVARHRIVDPRQGHEESEQAAEHRDDHDPREDMAARWPEQTLARLRRERLAGGHALQRDEIEKHRARNDVDHGHDRHAEGERPGQRTRRITRFARELADFPPAAEGEKRSHEPRGQRHRKGIRAGALGHEGHEVRPASRMQCQRQHRNEGKSAELEGG